MSRLQKTKAMTHTMEALCKNDNLIHNKLKVLKNTTAVIATATFNDLQSLKTRISGQDENLDILNRINQNFLTVTNDKFCKMTVTQINHLLVSKMLTKAFMAFTNVLRKSI